MSYIGAEPSTAAFPFDQFSGTGAATSFTLTYAPAGTTSILVAISGVTQNPNLYSVIGTTLSFSPAPPAGTNNISVLYLGMPVIGSTSPGNTAFLSATDLTATAGQTVFASAGSYTPGFVQVYRNGARLGNTDFTATNGTTITLASAAAAGDLVTIEYYTLTSLTNALPLTGGTVTGSTTFNTGVNLAAVSGNVGIGTTSPTVISGYTTLEVNGNASGSILDMAQGDAMKGRLVAVSAGFTVETSAGIPINFAPGGTNRMTISPTGYVTTSNQPMFSAIGTVAGWWEPGTNANFYIPTNSTGAANQTVSGVFAGFGMTASSGVSFNTGNHYNPATGIFTAPTAGRYFFFAGGLFRRNSSTATEYGSIASFVNGSLTYAGADQQPYQYTTAVGAEFFYHLSFFINLSANDGVSVRFAKNGTIQTYSDRFVFGGYLVG